MSIGILFVVAISVAYFHTIVVGITTFVLGAWLFSEYGMWRYRKFLTSDAFEHTTAESQSLRTAVSNSQSARNDEAKAQQKILRLERQGVNLRTTKSGKFDGRNKLGRKLNKKLSQSRQIALHAKYKAIEEEAKVRWLTELPRSRARGWIKSEATRSANRLVMICFTASLIGSYLVGSKPTDIWLALSFGVVGLIYLVRFFYRRRLSTKLGVT